MDGMPAILATVTLVGFAIQQLLEVLSPIGAWFAKECECGTAEERKKWAMAVLGFGLGCIAVKCTEISLLGFVKPAWKGGWGDFLVTALVFGSGSEGINTLLKFFQYVKDGRKKEGVAVGVAPPMAAVPPDQGVTLKAMVTGTADTSVEWSVADSNGGTVDGDGRYTAPAAPGTYRVVATSKADPTKHATVDITVR